MTKEPKKCRLDIRIEKSIKEDAFKYKERTGISVSEIVRNGILRILNENG